MAVSIASANSRNGVEVVTGPTARDKVDFEVLVHNMTFEIS